MNLARRIKRHVWAPVWDWFAVCPPGLEWLCAQELRGLGLEEVEPQEGGVAFRGKLEAGYRANLWLRSASRVLMRLADFRVRGWDDLLRQAARPRWEVFIAPGAPLRVQVSLKQSNLKHQGRIAEEVFDAVVRRLEALGLEPPRPAQGGEDDNLVQRLLVRGYGRRASLSLDTTGPHLHRRGYRLEGAQAPLRENLAAALLLFAGYQGQEPLVDPMCGSGTLAIEAALLARRLPPGGQRRFVFQRWPSLRVKTWEHLRRKAAEAALPRAPHPIWARDRHGPVLEAARRNAQRAGVEADLEMLRADFFKAPAPPGPGLVVINPPYGRRLGSVRQARELMVRLGRHLRRAYAGWRVAAVLYRPEWVGLLGLRGTKSLTVPHGGLRVTLVTGRLPAA